MHDRLLDGLSDYLIRLSRVPGLGFLERHATAATWMKHGIEERLGDIGEKQQGLEEGYELLQETFGKKRPSATATTEPSDQAAATPVAAPQAKVVAGKPLRAAPAAKSTDAKFKQKLVMQTIKRRRY